MDPKIDQDYFSTDPQKSPSAIDFFLLKGWGCVTSRNRPPKMILWNLGFLPDSDDKAHILDPIAGTGLHGVGEPRARVFEAVEPQLGVCSNILAYEQWP